MKDIDLKDLINEGLSVKEASMALEAYCSSRIEGATPMTAKRLAEMIRGRDE